MPNAPGRWLEWVDQYLPSADGAEVLAVGRDVTERHIAELFLADSEARFRELADNSADVVWRFFSEPYPHFDYLSPSIEKILGYPASVFLDDFNRLLEILDHHGRRAHPPITRRRADAPALRPAIPLHGWFHSNPGNADDRHPRRPARCEPRCHRTAQSAREPGGTSLARSIDRSR